MLYCMRGPQKQKEKKRLMKNSEKNFGRASNLRQFASRQKGQQYPMHARI